MKTKEQIEAKIKTLEISKEKLLLGDRNIKIELENQIRSLKWVLHGDKRS